MDDLFAFEEDERRAEELAKFTEEHKRSWKICWDWDGPTVGGRGSCEDCTSPLAMHTELGRDEQYLYMLEFVFHRQLPDGRWICEIDDWNGLHKGTLLLLAEHEIWAPTDELLQRRRENESEEETG